MPDICQTVKIMPSHPSQGDFVEINAEDFDKKVHEPYEAPKGRKKAAAAEPEAEAEAEAPASEEPAE